MIDCSSSKIFECADGECGKRADRDESAVRNILVQEGFPLVQAYPGFRILMSENQMVLLMLHRALSGTKAGHVPIS